MSFTVAAVLLLLLVFRPFEKLEAAVPVEPADIWAKRVAAYGLTPVFPPQEDFQVGDVWLTINPDDITVPFRKRSMRVGHIDARAAIRQSSANAIVFQPTAFVPQPEGATTKDGGPAPRFAAPDQPDSEAEPADDGKIRLSSVYFPTVTFQRDMTSHGSVGLDWLSFGARRRGVVTESISVPGAQTYGFEAPQAVPMIAAWCAEEANHHFCTDGGARASLAFAVDPRVLERQDGKPVPITLQLVTRVYLTREISYTYDRYGTRSASLDADDGSAEGEEQADGDGAAPADPASADKPTTGQGGGLAESASGKLVFRDVFERPLAFGYRATTLTPPKED